MAQTRIAYAAVDDTEVDAESPITESLMTRLRDQWFGALADAASAAPATDRVALPERAKTAEADTDKVLKPDGTGGVTWGALPSTDVLGTIASAGAGVVGTYAFVRHSGLGPGGSVSLGPGATIAGSSLRWTNTNPDSYQGATLTGTWMILGLLVGEGSPDELYTATLAKRIA